MSEALACPKGHPGAAHHVRKDGWATTKDGRRQIYRCISPEGVAHRFYGPTTTTAAPVGRRTDHKVRCPQPGHADGFVQSRGTRPTKTGTWQRFTCVRPNGHKHSFRVMLEPSGQPTTPRNAPPPPACTEHPGSRVVRAGTYSSGNSRRQRYQCHPKDGSRPHQFTPPLAREAVTSGASCTRCDELLSPHHGPISAARHTPWTLTGVAKALNDLSLGESYANVSLALRAQRDAARQHLHDAHGIDAFGATVTSAASTSTSYTRRDKRNAWRVAADLVEQYSPPLYAAVDAQLRADAEAQRVENDALLAANPNARLPAPIVYVIDEMPVWTRTNGVKRPTWNVLTVAEVRWKDTDDPFAPPQRDSRLRLARAFPRSNADAWQLVLDEVGVRPDFVVADYGTGLQLALQAYYGDSVGVVPSLWHMHRNIRDVLVDLPNTTFLDGQEKVLIDPLRKHLSLLARDELIGRTRIDIEQWWDELETIVAALPAPVVKVKTQRDLQEPRLVEALPILTTNPHVPASNAAVENRIRNALKPFLENRAHMFGNQERTNRLLNLLVCRQAGAFNDLDALALSIRSLNEGNGGWAPAPRQILDRQPPTSVAQGKPFQSLKSHNVVARLAKNRGITTRAQAQAAAPMPLLTTRSPARLANLAIRDWARSVGLTVGPTAPIKAEVQAAYDAAKNGTTDEQALKVYESTKAELEARRKEARKARRKNLEDELKRTAELAPLRKWAADNGYDIPPRSPAIPDHVVKAYQAAQKGKTLKQRPSKQPRKRQP